MGFTEQIPYVSPCHALRTPSIPTTLRTTASGPVTCLPAYSDTDIRHCFRLNQEAAVPLPFRIEYSPDTRSHLRALTTRHRVIVLDEVDRQLTHEPVTETRNRKPCGQTRWLRGNLGLVLYEYTYDVEGDPDPVVYIRAVGVKVGHRVRTGKEVIQL